MIKYNKFNDKECLCCKEFEEDVTKYSQVNNTFAFRCYLFWLQEANKQTQARWEGSELQN